MYLSAHSAVFRVHARSWEPGAALLAAVMYACNMSSAVCEDLTCACASAPNGCILVHGLKEHA
jgi:hypothetical protein